MSIPWCVHPVTLPPGRASEVTSPLPTGLATRPMTMGIVVVACLAARAAGVLEAKITSTLRRTSSAASSGSRSYFPSAARNLNGDALALDPAEIAEPLQECLHQGAC